MRGSTARAPGGRRPKPDAEPRAGDLAAVLTVLVGANLLNNWLLPRAYVVTCVAAAALLVALARRDGCSWSALGLGREALEPGLRWAGALVAAVLLGYLVAVALPATRQAFADTRATSLSGAVLLGHLLVRVPLGTALLEEVAFRGVIYAMVERRRGVRAAIAGSSLLFGLWHVLPSLGLRHANAAVAGALGAGTAGALVAVVAATAGTALAGVAFCELRRRSGGLVAPFALHWALNGFGLLVAWLAFGGAG